MANEYLTPKKQVTETIAFLRQIANDLENNSIGMRDADLLVHNRGAMNEPPTTKVVIELDCIGWTGKNPKHGLIGHSIDVSIPSNQTGADHG